MLLTVIFLFYFVHLKGIKSLNIKVKSEISTNKIFYWFQIITLEKAEPCYNSTGFRT